MRNEHTRLILAGAAPSQTKAVTKMLATSSRSSDIVFTEGLRDPQPLHLFPVDNDSRL
jgi:hypothetical protein